MTEKHEHVFLFDAVFQPRKIERSGLWQEFKDQVLIYVHKESMPANVETHYPAEHYVMVDDKLRLLAAIKKIWGKRVTTVFVKQCHYANEPGVRDRYPSADIHLERNGDLLDYDQAAFFRDKFGRVNMKATEQLHDLGQSLRLDNITRELLTSGTLKRYITKLSVTGLTSKLTRAKLHSHLYPSFSIGNRAVSLYVANTINVRREPTADS